MRPQRGRARGMTLIEMMVALVAGLILSAAVFSVLKAAEGRKRTLTSVNDVSQAGNYAMYLIDRWVRGAGNGVAQAADYAYGCAIYAASGGTQILPRTSALPAPFDTVVSGVSATFRLAPVVILPDATTPGASGHTSDVLVVMAGASGTASLPSTFNGFPDTASLTLTSTLGLNASDLLLVADKQQTNCMVEQVASSFSGSGTSVALSGTYAASTVNSISLTSFDKDSAAAMSLGAASSSSGPQFLVIGVGDDNVLYSYDLLKLSDTPLQARAEGVFEMHALYGIDSDGDGKISASEWYAPTSDSYKPSVLLDGSSASNKLLQKIKAVRVGLILRTALPERAGSSQAPTATSIKLFEDTTLTYTRSFSTSEQTYRYRKVELTIPVRNNLL